MSPAKGMESRSPGRVGPAPQVNPKPASGGSWWLDLPDEQFAARQRVEQDRMSGTTTTYAKPEVA